MDNQDRSLPYPENPPMSLGLSRAGVDTEAGSVPGSNSDPVSSCNLTYSRR